MSLAEDLGLHTTSKNCLQFWGYALDRSFSVIPSLVSAALQGCAAVSVSPANYSNPGQGAATDHKLNLYWVQRSAATCAAGMENCLESMGVEVNPGSLQQFLIICCNSYALQFNITQGVAAELFYMLHPSKLWVHIRKYHTKRFIAAAQVSWMWLQHMMQFSYKYTKHDDTNWRIIMMHLWFHTSVEAHFTLHIHILHMFWKISLQVKSITLLIHHICFVLGY